MAATLCGDEILVLRVPSEVRPDERAKRTDLQVTGTDVVERALHERTADALPLPLRIDIGVHQLEHTGLDAIQEEPGDLAVDFDVVAQLVRAIGDGHSRSSRTSANSTASCHSPWRRYALRSTPSRTQPARSEWRIARSLKP